MSESSLAEVQEIAQRLRWLIEEEKVRPQDILVLAFTRARIGALAAVPRNNAIGGVEGLHIAFRERDRYLDNGACSPSPR